MPAITFKFRLDKLVHSLAFFAEKGVADLTKLKAAKLLYFADKSHLLEHGRPILGDVYFCMKYGPVPSFSLNQMSDAINVPEVDDDDASMFRDVVNIHTPLLARNAVFRSRGRFDRAVFSESELAVLEDTVSKYGKLTAGKLVELSHADPTWSIPNRNREPEGRAPIPYEMFFTGAPARAQEILSTMKAEREEARELDSFINANS